MSNKPKVEMEKALPIAEQLRDMLRPFCQVDRCEIVGSLRRQRGFVGDVEILYVPKFRLIAADLFSAKAAKMQNTADEFLDSAKSQRIIAPRINRIGQTAWGEENKYAVHCASGLAVDFFATDEACWWNNLVTRTGGKQSNINICSAARRLGWKYESTGAGFLSLRGLGYHRTTSERDVFEFVRLPYLEPQNRP